MDIGKKICQIECARRIMRYPNHFRAHLRSELFKRCVFTRIIGIPLSRGNDFDYRKIVCLLKEGIVHSVSQIYKTLHGSTVSGQTMIYELFELFFELRAKRIVVTETNSTAKKSIAEALG